MAKLHPVKQEKKENINLCFDNCHRWSFSRTLKQMIKMIFDSCMGPRLSHIKYGTVPDDYLKGPIGICVNALISCACSVHATYLEEPICPCVQFSGTSREMYWFFVTDRCTRSIFCSQSGNTSISCVRSVNESNFQEAIGLCVKLLGAQRFILCIEFSGPPE